MKKLASIFVYFTGFTVFSACTSSGQEKPLLQIEPNSATTEVRLARVLGTSDYTIVYGWATWCVPCLKSIQNKLPRLQQKIDSLDLPVKIVAICSDKKKSSKFLEYHQQLKDAGIDSYFIENTNTFKGDKYVLNELFENNLLHYQKSDGVPIVLLIDPEKNIITQDNWLVDSPQKFREYMEREHLLAPASAP